MTNSLAGNRVAAKIGIGAAVRKYISRSEPFHQPGRRIARSGKPGRTRRQPELEIDQLRRRQRRKDEAAKKRED
jgi:hypothetical protein